MRNIPVEYGFLSRLTATAPLVQTLAAWWKNHEEVSNITWISFNIWRWWDSPWKSQDWKTSQLAAFENVQNKKKKKSLGGLRDLLIWGDLL